MCVNRFSVSIDCLPVIFFVVLRTQIYLIAGVCLYLKIFVGVVVWLMNFDWSTVTTTLFYSLAHFSDSFTSNSEYQSDRGIIASKYFKYGRITMFFYMFGFFISDLFVGRAILYNLLSISMCCGYPFHCTFYDIVHILSRNGDCSLSFSNIL